jgi:hypothetical protein
MWTARAGASPCRRPRTPQREPETAASPFPAWGGDASQGSASRRTIHPDWRDEPAVRDVGSTEPGWAARPSAGSVLGICLMLIIHGEPVLTVWHGH